MIEIMIDIMMKHMTMTTTMMMIMMMMIMMMLRNDDGTYLPTYLWLHPDGL